MFQRIQPFAFILPLLFVAAFPVFETSGGSGTCVHWYTIDCNGTGQETCPTQNSAEYFWGWNNIIRNSDEVTTNCDTFKDEANAPCKVYSLYQDVAGAQVGCGLD